MASPFRPLPGTDPNDPVARPNTTPAPAPPLSDPLAWVKSRIPVWQQTNPWISHDTPEYLAARIVENGGLTDPTHGADYWNQRMATPEPLWGAAHPAPKTRSPYMTAPTDALAEAAPESSDAFQDIMARLQAQQTGEAEPLIRQAHLRMLRDR